MNEPSAAFIAALGVFVAAVVGFYSLITPRARESVSPARWIRVVADSGPVVLAFLAAASGIILAVAAFGVVRLAFFAETEDGRTTGEQTTMPADPASAPLAGSPAIAFTPAPFAGDALTINGQVTPGDVYELEAAGCTSDQLSLTSRIGPGASQAAVTISLDDTVSDDVFVRAELSAGQDTTDSQMISRRHNRTLQIGLHDANLLTLVLTNQTGSTRDCDDTSVAVLVHNSVVKLS